MKEIGLALAVLGFSWFAFSCGYRSGRRAGSERTTRHYESVIADCVESQVKDTRRVMSVIVDRARERNCHE